MSAQRDAQILTVADVLAHGADAVQATCRYCGHIWSAPIGFLPERIMLEKVCALLLCPTCDRTQVDVEPEWPGGAEH